MKPKEQKYDPANLRHHSDLISLVAIFTGFVILFGVFATAPCRGLCLSR
jgi:hypothetical protein